MAKGTEVAVAENDAELELSEAIAAEEAALVEANQSEVDASEFVIPILKLAQPLTDEVTAGEAKAGEFVLPLTGESYPAPVEFIVAGKGKGRFKPGRKGERTLVAYDTNIVPWKDDPFFGKPFSEHPDAEEQFRARVDAGDQEWEHGPPIQTTYNYTGYLIGSEVPVRLSLRRTSAPAARKWNTLLDAVLRGRYWDRVFTVGSEQQKNDQGAFYVVTVNQGRNTDASEKMQAIQLATALRNQQVTTVGDAEDGPTKEPDAQGGLEV